MRTLDEIHGACRIDEDSGCWIWGGAYSGGIPRIYAPDNAATLNRLEVAIAAAIGSRYEAAMTKAALLEATDPVMTSQPGRRAVWGVASGKPIPAGHRVYGVCLNDACVNPDHMRCGSNKDVGRFTAKTGRFKNQPKRITANRKIGLQRSHLTPELVNEILLSDETGVQITARTGIGRTVVSRVRRGSMIVHQPARGVFAGLGART